MLLHGHILACRHSTDMPIGTSHSFAYSPLRIPFSHAPPRSLRVSCAGSEIHPRVSRPPSNRCPLTRLTVPVQCLYSACVLVFLLQWAEVRCDTESASDSSGVLLLCRSPPPPGTGRPPVTHPPTSSITRASPCCPSGSSTLTLPSA